MSAVLLAAVSLLALADPAEEKLPVPGEAALREAGQVVEEVFGDAIREARTHAARQAAWKRLVREADAAADDPAGRYALLRAALSVAPDPESALAAVDRLGRSYRIDAPQEKAASLAGLAKAAAEPAEHAAVAAAAREVMEEAAGADAYETAFKLADLGEAAAQKARDGGLARAIRARERELRKSQAAFVEAQAALPVLNDKPADPKANLTVGRYRCLVKGDWESGLSMLALGEDAALKDLAARELRKPTSSADQAALADGWFSVAEKASESEKVRLLERAGHWYRRALESQPALAGLERAKIEKRARELPGGPDSASGNPAPKAKETARPMIALPAIALPVNAPWPFRLPVKKGQTLSITATGRWRVQPRGKWHGPDDREFYLAGRLGGGEPFKVGAECAVEVKQDGFLYLGMMENGKYGNNSGSIRVVIEKSR